MRPDTVSYPNRVVCALVRTCGPGDVPAGGRLTVLSLCGARIGGWNFGGFRAGRRWMGIPLPPWVPCQYLTRTFSCVGSQSDRDALSRVPPLRSSRSLLGHGSALSASWPPPPGWLPVSLPATCHGAASRGLRSTLWGVAWWHGYRLVDLRCRLTRAKVAGVATGSTFGSSMTRRMPSLCGSQRRQNVDPAGRGPLHQAQRSSARCRLPGRRASSARRALRARILACSDPAAGWGSNRRPTSAGGSGRASISSRHARCWSTSSCSRLVTAGPGYWSR